MGRLVRLLCYMWSRAQVQETHVSQPNGERSYVWHATDGKRKLYWLVVIKTFSCTRNNISDECK